MAKIEIPIWEKINLTLPEAAALFSIGENQIRDLSNEPGCEFVIFKGSHRPTPYWHNTACSIWVQFMHQCHSAGVIKLRIYAYILC